MLPTLALLFERVISSQLYNRIMPFIPQSQYGFVKGTGAQDCGTVIALFATQALELLQECRVVSLDIKGAFDRIWWNGLLQHLSCIGIRGRAFALFQSYLSNRYLYVVANASESSQYPIQAGVPQGAVWSPMLFNLYVRQLPSQVRHSFLVSYADDSTLLKIVPSKEARKLAAEEINSDLNAIVCWGKKWHIEFEPAKSSSLCISLKRDLEDHPSLVMDGIPIKEAETLSVLGFHFDRRLTWAAMIDVMVSRSRQRLGCLRRILDYLDSNTLQLAYKAFIRPIMEYGNVAIMGASATQLSRLDTIQHAATKLCCSSFVSLQYRRHAAAVGLLLKMLDGCCRELLQTFCLVFSTSHFTLRRSSRLATSAQPYLLADTVVYNSLDIFRRSFLGSMTKIWQNEVPICLRQDGHFLDGELYLRTFNMSCVHCRICNGHVRLS